MKPKTTCTVLTIRLKMTDDICLDACTPIDMINLPPPALHSLYLRFLNHTTWHVYLFYVIYYHTEHKINLHFNSFVFQNDFYQFKCVYEFKVNSNCHVYNSIVTIGINVITRLQPFSKGLLIAKIKCNVTVTNFNWRMYESSSKEISIAIFTTFLSFSRARLLIGVGILGVDTPIVYKSSCQ